MICDFEVWGGKSGKITKILKKSGNVREFMRGKKLEPRILSFLIMFMIVIGKDT